MGTANIVNRTYGFRESNVKDPSGAADGGEVFRI